MNPLVLFLLGDALMVIGASQSPPLVFLTGLVLSLVGGLWLGRLVLELTSALKLATLMLTFEDEVEDEVDSPDET